MKIKDLDLLLKIEDNNMNGLRSKLMLLALEKQDLLQKIDTMNQRFLKSKPDMRSPNFTRYRAQEIRRMEERIAIIDQENTHLEEQIREIARNTKNYEYLKDKILKEQKHAKDQYNERQIEELMAHRLRRKE